MSDSEEERRILKEMEERGVPLEIDIANWLHEKRLLVAPQFAYLDSQTGKIRTIDFLAFYFDDYFLFPNCPRVIVECKKSVKPWIFYSFPSLPIEITMTGFNVPSGITILSLLQSRIDVTKPEILFNEEIFGIMSKLHYFDKNLPEAHSCYVAHPNRARGKAKPLDNFQKAKFQIIEAYTDLVINETRSPVISSIVLRGKMFEYKQKGNPKLTACNHVLFSSYEMVSKVQAETSTFAPPYVPTSIIDVVSDTYFPEYLEILKKDFQILKQAFQLLERQKK